jgi:hypothetical protein
MSKPSASRVDHDADLADFINPHLLRCEFVVDFVDDLGKIGNCGLQNTFKDDVNDDDEDDGDDHNDSEPDDDDDDDDGETTNLHIPSCNGILNTRLLVLTHPLTCISA